MLTSTWNWLSGLLFVALALMLAAVPIRTGCADSTAQTFPFSQDWTNTGRITPPMIIGPGRLRIAGF